MLDAESALNQGLLRPYQWFLATAQAHLSSLGIENCLNWDHDVSFNHGELHRASTSIRGLL